MRTINKTFNLYQFDELSSEVQERALSDYIDFEISVMKEDSPYYYCAEEAEWMQTPWFLKEMIYEKHKQDIIETIATNEYLFFEDGKFIPVDYYPD